MSERSISLTRRAASVVLLGVGLLFFAPPVYAVVVDWRGANNDPAWAQFTMFPGCSIPAVVCLLLAWRIRRGWLPSSPSAMVAILFSIWPAMALLHYAIYWAIQGAQPEHGGLYLFKFLLTGLTIGVSASVLYIWFASVSSDRAKRNAARSELPQGTQN